TVNPVNDAPTATNLSAAETYTEDTPLNLTDIVVSDVDSANVTAMLTLSDPAAGSLNTGTSGSVTSTYNAGTGVWTASGAVGDVNTLLAGVTFTPSGNYNSDFTIATSVDDGVAAPIAGAKSMTGIAVNDAPVLANNTLTITEGGSVVLSGSEIAATDVDNAAASLTFIVSAVSGGQFELVSSPSVAITSFTQAQISGGAIRFAHDGGEAAPSYEVIVSDSVLSDGPAPATINFTNQNDAPTATNLNAAETYTEDTPLNLTNIVVSDVDSASVTVTLTLSDPSAGGLNTATSGSMTSTYNAGTGVWTASGAIANVNTLLAGVTFTPSVNYNSNFTIAT
ncbi:MAG TPA: cadherin-like domain-containing protein, partial [Anaerolineae bacterium]